MILAVDVGNSNTTVGLFNGTGELLFRALLETSRSKTRDQCAIELLGVFQLYGADACTVDGAILSSVVPPLTAIFTDAIARLTGLALMTAIIVVLQVVASFVKFGPFTITLALAPVSYTHLDVYKRQAPAPPATPGTPTAPDFPGCPARS